MFSTVCCLSTHAAVGDPTLGPPFSPHNSGRDCAHSCSPPAPTMHCSRWAPDLGFARHPQRHQPGVLLQIPEEMSEREERCSQEVLMMFDKQIVFHMCTAVLSRTHTHARTSPSPAASAVTHSSLWNRYHD